MFVCSCRASTLKFFGVTTVALVALVALLVFIPSAEGAAVGESVAVSENVRYDKIKTAEDRVEFLKSLGWTVETPPVEEVEVTVPDEFDAVHESYNELQKEQGFDLTEYRKKKVMRYTYRITDYPGYDGEVFANILVYKKRVIGGDVCSADVNGFIHGLDRSAIQ